MIEKDYVGVYVGFALDKNSYGESNGNQKWNMKWDLDHISYGL